MKIFAILSILVFFSMIDMPLVTASEINPIYEKKRPGNPENIIDILVLKALKAKDIKSAELSSDAVFLRRIYQDITGSIPNVYDAKNFILDEFPEKRAELIDSLMEKEEFYEYWTLKWCDILRVKSEFPINLWPNATQAYHRWIYAAVKTNMPYDRFARELLLSSGSNFRNPEVNFYRALGSKTPEGIAEAVMLTFMGTAYSKWSDEQQKNIADFFSRVKYKSTDEWKEQIVYTDFVSGKIISTKLPDGTEVIITEDKDPRKVFTEWLVSDRNPWFARCCVNRIWYWLMGRGIVHEADDITVDSVPANPALLDYLEKEFIKSGYDVKHIIRLIVNSNTYQQSFIPKDSSSEAEKLFAYYIIRRLDAEIIIDFIDSLDSQSGRQKYVSLIPEPFTYIPVENRTISLSDGSISSKFLSTFGRPARDSGKLSERRNISSDSQRLFMLNSNYVHQKIMKSWLLKSFAWNKKLNNHQLIETIYLIFLNRLPSQQESLKVMKYVQKNKIKRYQAALYLSWALLNSKEFLYHH